jgi:hypothetical protein
VDEDRQNSGGQTKQEVRIDKGKAHFLIPNFKIPATGRQVKFETNSNDRNPKLRILPFWKFENLNFGFVSSFDIRISNLHRTYS